MNKPTDDPSLIQVHVARPSSIQWAKAFANHVMALLLVLFWGVVGAAGLTFAWIAIRLLWRFSGVLLRAIGME